MLAAWFILHAPARRELLKVVGGALVPATTLVLLITGMMRGAHVLGFKAGWMWNDDTYLRWCDEHLGQSSEFVAGLLSGL